MCHLQVSQEARTYLYIEKQNDFARVPRSLLQLLGKLEFVMALELMSTRTLAQADQDEVRSHLREQGYFLQMPPRDYSAMPN